MTSSGTSESIEALAANIGEVVYIDVAKWHLYLNDAKLHTPLAQRLYPMLVDNHLSATGVNQVLAEMTISLGGGRQSLPLLELIPIGCQRDLMRVLEDFKDKL
jgi:hypothetical protein